MFYQVSDISIIVHSLFHLLPSHVHISLLNSCDGHGGVLDGVSASEARVIFFIFLLYDWATLFFIWRQPSLLIPPGHICFETSLLILLSSDDF